MPQVAPPQVSLVWGYLRMNGGRRVCTGLQAHTRTSRILEISATRLRFLSQLPWALLLMTRSSLKWQR